MKYTASIECNEGIIRIVFFDGKKYFIDVSPLKEKSPEDIKLLEEFARAIAQNSNLALIAVFEDMRNYLKTVCRNLIETKRS